MCKQADDYRSTQVTAVLFVANRGRHLVVNCTWITSGLYLAAYFKLPLLHTGITDNSLTSTDLDFKSQYEDLAPRESTRNLREYAMT